MKKVSIMAALALAAGLASCSSQGAKSDLKNDVDSLSYAIGMSRTDGLMPYLQQQGIDSTQMASFLKGVKDGAHKTSRDDVAYAVGLRISQMLSTQWVQGFNAEIFAGDSTQTLDKAKMLEGFIAGVISEGGEMELSLAQEYARVQVPVVRERSLLKMFGDNKAAGEKFLAENKTKEGVVTTESGLQYKVITKGKGEIPQNNSRVKVNYRGTLIDGTEFESSFKRKDKDGNPQPAMFRANQVIKGWTEALTMMPVGSKWEIYIPQELAYGSRTSGQIKPYSALIFEVELVSIEKDAKKK